MFCEFIPFQQTQTVYTNLLFLFCICILLGDNGPGYDRNAALLKAKGYVLKCMNNGWCGYVDENNAVTLKHFNSWWLLVTLLTTLWIQL